MNDTPIFDFDDDESMPEVKGIKLFDFLQDIPKETSKKDRDCVTVYLAGPIEAELNQNEPHSISWREKIKALFDADLETVWDVRDPNKGKTDGKNYIKIEANSHHYNPYMLFKQDINNVAESDFIIVNLSRFITGFDTPFEMGYAFCKNIPIICICEPGVLPEHPFITQSVDAFAFSEEEAVNLLKFMLNEEV